MKRSEAKPIGQIITEAFRAAGTSDLYDRQRVCYLWTEVTGPTINRMTTRRWIDRDVLHVTITSASLRNDLQFLAPKLIERLNEAAGKQVITRIVFH